MITHITVEDAAKLISRIAGTNEMQALTYIREAADRGEIQAATALSTLKDENEKLRETVDKYATAARVIALHLKPFCDESLPYDEMIADAARKASDELERVKAERDAAVECINTVYSYILIKSKTDAVRTIEKWPRGQKED